LRFWIVINQSFVLNAEHFLITEDGEKMPAVVPVKCSDGRIYMLKRHGWLATLADRIESKTALSALSDSLSNVPVHISEPSIISKPWTAEISDIFDGHSVEDDGLTFRLEDCMI
jgi:hypothetical protein